MECEVKLEPPMDFAFEDVGESDPFTAGPSRNRKRPFPQDNGDSSFRLPDVTSSSIEAMHFILRQWGLEALEKRFDEHLIDVNVLDYILDADIVELCRDFPIRYRLVLRRNIKNKYYNMRSTVPTSQSKPRSKRSRQTIITFAKDPMQTLQESSEKENTETQHSYEDDTPPTHFVSVETQLHEDRYSDGTESGQEEEEHLQNSFQMEEIPNSAEGGQPLDEVAGIFGNPTNDFQVYGEEIGSADNLLMSEMNREAQEHASPSNGESPSFLSPNHLRALLAKTDDGKELLKCATTHKLSNDGHRLVVDTVARFHLSSGRKTTSESLSSLSDAIISVFPLESKDTYYLPKVDRANPGGKIYSRINYIKQRAVRRARGNENFAPMAGEQRIESQEFEPEVTQAVQWLATNNAPWTDVIFSWEVSHPARKRYLKQHSQAQKLIDDYPQLREKLGFQLLDIDYRLLGLENPEELSRKWEKLFEPVARYVCIHGKEKDFSTRFLLDGLRNTAFSTDVRLLQLLHVLSTVLIPVKVSKGYKPTVLVAQSDTFLLASSIESGRIELQKTLEFYDEQKMPVVPKLIVIGERVESVSGVCFVVYKSIEYQLPTITQGIDVLLKLHIVLGLPFSRLSKLVWVFIEKFLYNVEPVQGGYLSVNKLVEFLRSQPQREIRYC